MVLERLDHSSPDVVLAHNEWQSWLRPLRSGHFFKNPSQVFKMVDFESEARQESEMMRQYSTVGLLGAVLRLSH
jgi:hypothetical protein